ncbi:MAG: NAD-dependent epimerase/dehydratase family protein [Gammaproteobacteria bacterium]
MKVLVTGATGFVGSHLVHALLQRGDSVRVLARSAERATPLGAAGAEVRIGDLALPEGLAGIADGVDVVFHLGSAMHGSREVFERVDVGGTEWMLREAERARVARVVYVGTVSCYPIAQMKDNAVVDEHCLFDETGLLGHYARAKSRAEAAVLAADRRGAIEGVIVRLGLVCGAGTSVFPPHIGQVVGGKRMLLFGDGSVPLPLTYIDNAVDALILGGTVPGIRGESFNILDDDVLTQRQYIDLLQNFTGGKPRLVRLPRLAYFAIAAVSEILAAVRRKEPSTNRYRVKTRLRRVRWNCSKAKRLLHWRPRVPLREGLRQTFRAYAART